MTYRIVEAKQIVGPYIFREDIGQTTKVILKNGLTVIVREQHAVPLSSVVTYVKAGYFDEDDRISGISHVIEHMFFKGTTRRQVGQIARETKDLGGYLNARTFYDRTVYYTVVPSENTEKAIDIQADALWNSTLDAEELKREIEVVLQENRRKLDTPPAVASEKLYSVAFQQHRMRRWRIGEAEALRALTRDDLVAYFRNYYQPSNIILTIVGKFDREEMLKQVVRLYAAVEDRTVERDRSPKEAAQKQFRRGWEQGALEQAHVAIGFHVPGILSPEARAFEALSAVLSAGRASRLNRFLRDEKGLVTSASADFLGFPELGYLEINIETPKPPDAQVGLLAELENIKKFGITQEELARAKSQIARSHYHKLETVNGIGEELAQEEALGDWKRSERTLEEIVAVTTDDVLQAARKYLIAENLSVFEYVPRAMSPIPTEDEYQKSVLDQVASAVESRTTEDLPSAAEIPTTGGGVLEDIVKPIIKRSILRGPDVYVREDRRLPLVSLGVFYPGGRLNETAENTGITELMLRTALRGTNRFNSAEIARQLENTGAELHIVNEPDFFGYVIDGLTGRLDEAARLLVDVLQEPTFPDEQVAWEKELQLARIGKIRESNYLYPMQLILRTLFGEHAYGRSALGNEKTVSNLSATDLDGWFERHQRTVVPLIVIVGDTQGTGLIASIADALTNEDLHAVDLSGLPAPTMRIEVQEAIETVPRQQTALVYGLSGVAVSHPDRFPLTVLRNIVSGLGGRFFEAVREKQGLSYMVVSSNIFFSKTGAFLTYTAFSPENELKVRASLDREMERLRSEGVSREEVRMGINYAVGEYEIALQTRTAQVLEYTRAILSGSGTAAVTNYSTFVQNVTTDDVKGVATRYLDPKKLKVAIVRGSQ